MASVPGNMNSNSGLHHSPVLAPSDLRLVMDEDGAVLLDDAVAETRRALLFRKPLEVIVAKSGDDVPGALTRLDAVLADGRWAAGYLSYEAGNALMGLSDSPGDDPLLWFGVYQQPLHVRLPAETCAPRPALAVALQPDRAAYEEMFARVRHHIHEGDVYQINLTGRAHLSVTDPTGTYLSLRTRQPVPYGAYINADRRILSLSPERFFRVDGGRILARPMKGTAPRGRSPEEDDLLARDLAADPKNQAENLMIVDLLRNDLSRVCKPGSVTVPSLFNVEAHPTLWQMTSDVEGELSEGVMLSEVFGALFPCGSITGAPKRRAMEIIRDIEPWPRGVYCGTIGYASPDGTAEFSVAIRTIELRGHAAVMGTGSGIVWDSNAQSEYDEMLLKTRFVHSPAAVTLLETMRSERGTVIRLERHLARLRSSAIALQMSLDEDAIRIAVLQAASEESCLLRLTLASDGELSIESLPLRDWESDPVPVVFVRREEHGVFTPHKTTDRRHYEEARKRARARGAEEAILINDRGFVTEGTITNVFVEVGGELLTPPVSDGLIPGVLRAELIDEGKVREASIDSSMLAEADAIYVGNTVRGLRRAILIEPPDASITETDVSDAAARSPEGARTTEDDR